MCSSSDKCGRRSQPVVQRLNVDALHSKPLVSLMTRDVYLFEVKEKGRSVLPAGLRAQCGFEVGMTIVAVALGPGRALIQTRDALLEELWASQPATGGDGAEDLRKERAAESATLLAKSRLDEPGGLPDDTSQEQLEEFFASLADG